MGDANEQVAITMNVPTHHVGSLKDLLREFPAVHYFERGFIIREVAIIGSAQDIEALRPKLTAWKADCASGEAW